MRLYSAPSLSAVIDWLAYLSILQRVLLGWGVCGRAQTVVRHSQTR